MNAPQARARPVALTAELIEAFAGTFLSARYDGLAATPQFHREAWAAYCALDPLVALAAPREHAKTTALAFVFILAEVMFRISDYVILVGSTEENAAEILSNIIEECRENDDLRAEFGILDLERDSQTDLIILFDDGHRARVLARGAEQKIRGKMWNGRRPNLLVCDDMEDDEQVENKDRRKKFKNWFFRAARQAVSRRGRIRVHGTILHEDSLLSRLLRNKQWKSLFYKAHNAFDDFSKRLWPAAWTIERLKARRQEFIEDGDSAGYSQEFLNDPQDNADAYLRKSGFLPMEPSDHSRPKVIYAAADFAVSKDDMANRTSFTVGGKCPTNLIHVVDQRVARWASFEIVQRLTPEMNSWSYIEDPKTGGYKVGWIIEMIFIQRRWNPDYFFVEDGVIWKAIKHMFYNQIREEECPINIVEVPSIKDKATRGRPFQKRHASGMMRYDKEAEWYPGYEAELLRFTGNSQATLDDQFDSTSLLVAGFELHKPEAAEEDDFLDDEELSMREAAHRRRSQPSHGAPVPVNGY